MQNSLKIVDDERNDCEETQNGNNDSQTNTQLLSPEIINYYKETQWLQRDTTQPQGDRKKLQRDSK